MHHHHLIVLLIPQYLDYCLYELGHSLKTIDNYKRELVKLARTIEIEHVEKLELNNLNDYFRYEEERGLKISSVNTQRRTMRSFFYYCQYYRKIPLQFDYSMIKEKKDNDIKKIKFATVEDVITIMERLESPQDRLIVATLFTSGMRISELVKLRVEDVRDTPELYVRGKGSKGRVVPITTDLHLTLKAHIFTNRIYTGPVFRHQVHKYALSNYGYTVSGLRNRFARKLKPYGLYASFHWYRHGIATSLYDDGADIRFIQDFLGHSDIRTTQIYTHVTAKRKRESYDMHFPKAFNVSVILDNTAKVC